MIRQLLTLGMIATCVGASAGTASGQTYTWTGAGTTSWNSPGNYTVLPITAPAVPNNAGVIVNYGNVTNKTVTINSGTGNRTVGQMNFTDNGYTIGSVAPGGSLTLANSGGAPGVVNVDDLVSVNFSARIVNSPFEKIGDGTMILSNSSLTHPNTFSAVTISGGTLQLGNSGVLPDSATITLNSGTLATNSFSDSTGTLNVTANSTLALGAGDHDIVFGSVGTSSGTLFIMGWKGDGTGGRIYFNSLGSDPDEFLSNVYFVGLDGYGGLGQAKFVEVTGGLPGNYQLVATPEPTTVLAFGAIGLSVVGRLRRRKGAAEAAPEPNVALAV